MAKSNAPVDKEDVQAVSILRELAANKYESFTQEELFRRAGIDPYNSDRRAARFVRALVGYAIRFTQIQTLTYFDRGGMPCQRFKRVFMWTLDDQLFNLSRAEILRQYKAAHA